MKRSELLIEGIVTLTVGGVSALLFWMALYMVGPFVLIPGAAALLAALAWRGRHMSSPRRLIEGTGFSLLLAGQACVLSAMLLTVIPDLVVRVL